MSLPSMTDASESKKKLQCARSRPSRACDRWPLRSRNSRKASQRWPTSCPSTLSVLFSPRNFCVGSSGILAEPVHQHEAAQPAGAAEVARRVVDVHADAANLVGHGGLEGERVLDEWRVGPDDQLVVVVADGSVELARERHEIELGLLGEPFADRAGPAGGGPGVAQVDGVGNRRYGRARRPTTASPRVTSRRTSSRSCRREERGLHRRWSGSNRNRARRTR